MKPIVSDFMIIVVALLAPGCNSQTLCPEQQRLIGTWSLLKPSDHGSVYREITFHSDGVTFTTTCRSTFDDAVANGTGEGKWTIQDGVVNVKWTEKQIVGQHVQDTDYELSLRIDGSGEKTNLIASVNQDQYKRK